MSLPQSSRLGPYRILASIGAGGMGEVYRALDTRLNREVAIKILPEQLEKDAGLRQRFEREAHAVSSLNHPHICRLYDIGQEGETLFMVMELLEGETLAERLKKGALPLEQALKHAIEIAGALDAAHDSGVVHRDLKPANIVLTKSGAKLVDFGLAKRKRDDLGEDDGSSVSTRVKPLTEKGTILGTFQYMAPEQLEGEEADGRSDLFAFGTVLYEMVTGKKAFEGKSPASLIAAILSSEPRPVSEIQPLAPKTLDRILTKCLTKDPSERWQSALDLRDTLSWVLDTEHEFRGDGVRRESRISFVRGVALGVVGFALAVVFWAAVSHTPRPSPPLKQFVLPLPPDITLPSGEGTLLALSSDGTKLAFVGKLGSITRLFLRVMDEPEIRALAGTEGARHPAFSPDGAFLAFDDQNRLYKIAITGGPPVVLAEAGIYPSWGPDGHVYFWNEGLWRVSAQAGEPEKIAEVTSSRSGRPKILGRHEAVLFEGMDRVEVLSLRSGEKHIIAEEASNPYYVSSGHVLFAREGGLLAVRFDATRLTALGRPVDLGRDVMIEVGGAAQFTIADDGTFVYARASSAHGPLVEVDRQGSSRKLGSAKTSVRHPRMSPDGRRIVYELSEPNPSLWVQELDRDVVTRVTFEGSRSRPVWSPDGLRIACHGGNGSLWVTSADGLEVQEQLIGPGGARSRDPSSWSSDGRTIVFTALRAGTGRDIDLIDLEGGTTETLLGSRFSETQGALSPDGRWLAFTSDESGRRDEVFVIPFPQATRKWQISADGGTAPSWSHDGRELFYRNGDRMMAVSIETEPDFSPGRPVVLFERSFASGGNLFTNHDVASNGSFIMVGDEVERRGELQVVLNWYQELEALAPGRE